MVDGEHDEVEDDLDGDDSGAERSAQAKIVYLQYRSEHWDDDEGFAELLMANPELREELLEEQRKWPDVKALMTRMLPNVSGSEGCMAWMDTIRQSMRPRKPGGRGAESNPGGEDDGDGDDGDGDNGDGDNGDGDNGDGDDSLGSDSDPNDRGPGASVLRAIERSDLSERYIVLHEFHRTGQSVLFKVWDRKLARPSVMKVLLDSPAEADMGPLADLLDSSSETPNHDRARLLKEALVTSQLEHPVIVPVYDVGIDATGRLCFVLKLIEGETFGEVISRVHDENDDWTLNRAVGVLRRICDALAYAHSRQVIHRDIKPHNFMVGRFGEAVLMDWGLHLAIKPAADGETASETGADAKPDNQADADADADADTDTDTDTDTGEDTGSDNQDALMAAELSAQEAGGAESSSPFESWALSNFFGPAGTPVYMSPEQARGHRHRLGPATDIYSLGAVLYHLILGSPPYLERDTGQTQIDVVRLVKTRPPESLALLCPRAPAELVAICNKAMDRDIEDRYASAEALGDALAEYLEAVSKDRQDAVRQARRAQANSKFLLKVLTSRDPDRAQGRDVTVREAMERASADLETDPPDQVEDGINLRRVLGGLYVKLGQPNEARVHLTAAYEALVDLGVKWREDALHMAASLAWCRHRCGESAEAVVDLRRILEEQERLLGAMHADTLRSCWLLGHAQHNIVHNFDEVRRLYERVIEGGTIVHGELSMEVLNAKNGLARVLCTLGEHERGIQLQEECVKGMLAAHGRTSTDTLIQLGDLAIMYFDVARFDEAVKLSEQVLKDQIRVLGEDHAHTQATRGNLGSIYRKQGRLELSREMALKSWESCSKTAGENAMYTLTLGHNLALVDIDLGLLEEAESLLSECIERLSKLYPKHRLLGRALTNLGRCMLLTQRPQEARVVLVRALQILREVLEPGSDWIVEAETLRDQCDGDKELGGGSKAG